MEIFSFSFRHHGEGLVIDVNDAAEVLAENSSEVLFAVDHAVSVEMAAAEVAPRQVANPEGEQ